MGLPEKIVLANRSTLGKYLRLEETLWKTTVSYAREPMMDGSPCLEPGTQTSSTTEDHPSVQRMPGEILNMILEYSFDLGSSREA